VGTDIVSDRFAPAMAEIHSALVFFVGDRAYKLKRSRSTGAWRCATTAW
jgi:aminoglycoside phosphotransferase family enzyme